MYGFLSFKIIDKATQSIKKMIGNNLKVIYLIVKNYL